MAGGHLHVPPIDAPKAPTAPTDKDFEADRKAVVDQTLAVVRAAVPARG